MTRLEGGFGKTATELKKEKMEMVTNIIQKQNEVEHVEKTVTNAKKVHVKSEKDATNEMEYKKQWWKSKLKRKELPPDFFTSTEGESERKKFLNFSNEQYAFRYNGKVM